MQYLINPFIDLHQFVFELAIVVGFFIVSMLPHEKGRYMTLSSKDSSFVNAAADRRGVNRDTARLIWEHSTNRGSFIRHLDEYAETRQFIIIG